jgi:hypothetical protein
MKYTASSAILIRANSHMERGGRPVNNSRKKAKTPLISTCQPIAIYFSCDLLSSRFQRACREADVRRSRMATAGIMPMNVP